MKGFQNSYYSITNVPVCRSATSVVHYCGTVDILISNETLLFGNLIDQFLINPDHISSLFIPVSDNPLDRTWEFGIYHEELFITFNMEVILVLFDTFAPSEH